MTGRATDSPPRTPTWCSPRSRWRASATLRAGRYIELELLHRRSVAQSTERSRTADCPRIPIRCLPGRPITATDQGHSSAAPRCGDRVEPHPGRVPASRGQTCQPGHPVYDRRRMARISFLVSTLLAFALAALVLAAALLVGIFPSGPGGVASGSPRPSFSFPIGDVSAGIADARSDRRDHACRPTPRSIPRSAARTPSSRATS